MIELKHTRLFIRPERVSAVIVDAFWDGTLEGYKLVIDGKIIVVDKQDKDILIDNKLISED